MKRQAEDVDELPEIEGTPPWIVDFVLAEFKKIYAFPQNQFENPLEAEWEGFSFAHPPHSDAQLWCEKAATEAKKGHFSVLLLPLVCNSCYWRDIVYKEATEIRIFTCPIKMPGKKKQIVSQMCLVVFAGNEREDPENPYPPLWPIEPTNWKDAYYIRKRNKAQFASKK